MVKNKVANMFEDWKEEKKSAIVSESTEKAISKGLTVFGKVSGASDSLGIYNPMEGALRGAAAGRSLIDHYINKTFSPVVNELRFFSNQMAVGFDAFFYQNKEGAALGQAIGGGFGFIAGFYLPGGPAVWTMLFGAAGSALGAGIQNWIEGQPPSTIFDNPLVRGLTIWGIVANFEAGLQPKPELEWDRTGVGKHPAPLIRTVRIGLYDLW